MNLEKIYAFRFQGISPEKKAAVWGPITRHIQSFMPKADIILDPCAGRCEFINHVQAKEVWAVDREESFLRSAIPGVKTVAGDIFHAPLPENHFGGIFVSNFLEHLESAEQAATFLRRMRTLLSPGGRLVIMGPNFKYCGPEYFDCIDHRLILTERSVAELLFSEDFELVKSHARYLPYSFRSRLPASEALTGLYLKFPFAWKFLGKQFLLAAQKPG